MWFNTRTPRPVWAGIALLALGLATTSARAQQAGTPKPDGKDAKPEAKTEKKPEATPRPVLTLREPASSRVYQRGRDGRADIAVTLDGIEKIKGAKLSAQLLGLGLSARFEDGKLVGVPTGGPYSILVTVASEASGIERFQADNVFVGDLWILAGQSNMEGVADLIDVTAPNYRVNLLGMDGKWSRAEEPLHWLVDSPDPVHSGDPKDRAQRSAEQHKTRKKGASLGLPFADALARALNVPIGLVATAHGGTSMAQWSPEKKGEGGNSLYGSMLRSVKLAGGKVKGVLWYQGESDANPDAAKVYPKVFHDFIAAVRDDLGQPDLPFYLVQIGRFVRGGSPKDWNAVQDAERLIAERVPNTAVVTAVDLELDDAIHVGTQGHKRLGKRLAKIALRELYGQVGATTPTFDRVNKGPGHTLVVKFKGVNIAPDMVRGQPGTLPRMGGMQGPGSQGMMAVQVSPPNAGDATPAHGRVVGLKPNRHIAGFSIRKEDGEDLPIIFDAAVGAARDTVILKLTGPPPAKSFLWYGHGFDPYCNLVDALDMAVPVFGPIPLDETK